jgi:hypothetical protein
VTNPQLDAAQLRAWAKAKALVLETSEADWQLLAEAYGQTSGPAATYRRKDLAQLLNNWLGEIDRARDWRNRAGAEWSHATPATPASTRRTVIPLEPENWQSVAARIWPDSDPGTLGWNDLSPDVQVRIRQEIAASNSSAA